MKEALPWLLFTYLGAPLALLALCWPKLGARGKDEPPEEALELAVVCLALGPIAVATLTLFLFTAAPGSSYAFYRWTPVACFALLAATRFRVFANMHAAARRGWERVLAADPGRDFAIPMILLIIVFNLWQQFSEASLTALHGNDALEYASIARILYEGRDAGVYLFSAADPGTGFYTPSTHPLGYASMFLWNYLIQEQSTVLGLGKLVPLWAFTMCLCLLAVSLRRHSPFAVVAGAGLLFACPLLTYLVSYEHHVDPLLALGFLLSVFTGVMSIRRPSRRWCALAGASLGACLLAHSLGLLVLPFFCATFFLLSREPVSTRLQRLTAVVLVGCLIGGQQYLENTRERGRPIGDDNPIWKVERLEVKKWFQEDRGLTSQRNRIINGYFQSLTKPAYFGILPWLGGLGVVVALWRRRFEDLFLRFVTSYLVLFYVALFGLTFVVGSDLIIRNPRYFVFTMPLLAYPAALLCAGAYDRWFAGR